MKRRHKSLAVAIKDLLWRKDPQVVFYYIRNEDISSDSSRNVYIFLLYFIIRQKEKFRLDERFYTPVVS